MKTFTITFRYMVDTETLEDAVEQTVAALRGSIEKGYDLPFTVQEEGGDPMLVIADMSEIAGANEVSS